MGDDMQDRPQQLYLYCDGCGQVHEDTPEFVICECGRVGVRMEWATQGQIDAAVKKMREDVKKLLRAVMG